LVVAYNIRACLSKTVSFLLGFTMASIRRVMRLIKLYHLSITMILDGKLIHVSFKVIMLNMEAIVKPRRKLTVLLKQALML
jgi:hypothetical protein